MNRIDPFYALAKIQLLKMHRAKYDAWVFHASSTIKMQTARIVQLNKYAVLFLWMLKGIYIYWAEVEMGQKQVQVFFATALSNRSSPFIAHFGLCFPLHHLTSYDYFVHPCRIPPAHQQRHSIVWLHSQAYRHISYTFVKYHTNYFASYHSQNV